MLNPFTKFLYKNPQTLNHIPYSLNPKPQTPKLQTPDPKM